MRTMPARLRLRAITGLLALLVLVAGIAIATPGRALAVEPDGSFIKLDGTPNIYVVIGGAAVHVDSCGPLNGCPGVVQVSSLSGYAPVPANGSFMRVADGPAAGAINAMDGGSPIHVDTCAPLGGCSGAVNIDAGGYRDYEQAHPVPTNGSFIRVADGPGAGWIGEIVGAGAIHIDDCAPLNGCPGAVNLDSQGAGQYLSDHPAPANGSFVLVANGPSAGTLARAAGGALLTISDCSAIGGCGGYVPIDANGYRDYVAGHPTPADGTLITGSPSGQTWDILGGKRIATAPSAGAVAVDDASLAGIPIAPPAGSGSGATGLPHARHQPLRRVKVRLVLRWSWLGDLTQLVEVRTGHLNRRLMLRVRCSGRGCPRGLSTRHARAAGRGLRSLAGRVFRAGNRLLLELDLRGRAPERVQVAIRAGHIPRVTLLR